MDPITIAAIASAIPSVIKGVQGVSQGIKANKMAGSQNRPSYEVPPSATKALNESFMQSTVGVPGGDMYRDELDENFASGVGALRELNADPATLTAAVTAMNEQRNKGMNRLSANEMDYRQRAIMNYINQLQGMAGFEDQMFDYNRNQPYQNAMSAASAMRGAGQQNKFGAAQDIAALGTSYLMEGEEETGIPTNTAYNFDEAQPISDNDYLEMSDDEFLKMMDMVNAANLDLKRIK